MTKQEIKALQEIEALYGPKGDIKKNHRMRPFSLRARKKKHITFGLRVRQIILEDLNRRLTPGVYHATARIVWN